MGQLKASQFDVAHESTKDDADIVIVNTCGFIENAKQESIDTILAYADAKGMTLYTYAKDEPGKSNCDSE